MKNKKYLLILLIFTNTLYAQVYDYNLSLSSADETLVVLPSIVKISSCQPSGFLETVPLEVPPEPIIVDNLGQKSKIDLGDSHKNDLGNYIKMIPTGAISSKVVCSIKLVDSSVHNLHIKLDPKTVRPLIDLSIDLKSSYYEGEKDSVKAFLNLSSPLREHIFYRNPSPRIDYYSTDNARYKLVFHGLQGEFYGLILKVDQKNTQKEMILSNVPIGTLYLSAFEKNYLYILSKPNFKWNEIKKYLP